MRTWRRSVFQEVFEKRKFQIERLGSRDVRLARGQESAILVTEQGVDGHQVIEGQPVPRRVLHTAGNKHRT